MSPHARTSAQAPQSSVYAARPRTMRWTSPRHRVRAIPTIPPAHPRRPRFLPGNPPSSLCNAQRPGRRSKRGARIRRPRARTSLLTIASRWERTKGPRRSQRRLTFPVRQSGAAFPLPVLFRHPATAHAGLRGSVQKTSGNAAPALTNRAVARPGIGRASLGDERRRAVVCFARRSIVAVPECIA